MLEKQRQQLILDILAEQRFASVRSLSSDLGASEATIRRDITKMAARRLLNKIRGGAEVSADSAADPKVIQQFEAQGVEVIRVAAVAEEVEVSA